MLQLTYTEFFLRTIPELFVLIWGIHIISGKSINTTKYIVSSVMLSLATFFVRWLPIYFGVHMIINMILIISIMVIIRIPLIKAIFSTLIMFFFLCLGEFINMVTLDFLKIDTVIEFANPLKKTIYCFPSLIFLLLSIFIIKYFLKMKEGVEDVSN
ncbi:hypothetical protein CDLVIII_1446 [Clostridium sp. DL-VIII]|uniref:hypothetical protein n=1 Tax=Clostridium sp. DL-VIII TaxID=641107 RepID=UPI00023AF08F|nr:hypothetical protein [Clostridium sp. DL-VIII]EHI98139.1 hypothetical protein CDLVIII_1446 [Clostridium sp. DL-VIII]